MRLVVIESPYAPQTPKSDAKHVVEDFECSSLARSVYAPALSIDCPRCSVDDARAKELEDNRDYLRRAVLDSLGRGDEAPYASHMFYTQVLDDEVPAERKLGIDAGLAWGDRAHARMVYFDRGISRGMMLGIERAIELGQEVRLRSIEHVPGYNLVFRFSTPYVTTPSTVGKPPQLWGEISAPAVVVRDEHTGQEVARAPILGDDHQTARVLAVSQCALLVCTAAAHALDKAGHPVTIVTGGAP